MARNITLKDIARETGVHVSTVSRALDPNARTSLSPEVIQRVRKAAEQMGYRPNRLASGLRTRRTMTVGIMLPDITNTLFPPIVRGVESVLEPLGYASMLVNTDSDPVREARLVDVLLERGVDGIIDAAVLRNDPKMEAVARTLPVVTANRQVEESDVPAVVNDDAGGVRMMMRLLYETGHRRVAHIAGPAIMSTGISRRDAFLQSARELKLDLPARAVVAANRYDEDEGRRCTEKLLSSGWEFTALLCANDRLALGALDALAAGGLECPRDVSVTGYNDIPFLDRIPPGLTTIRVPQFDVGCIAAELLVKMLTSPGTRVPTTTILPVTLVERGSVAPPRKLNHKAAE